MPKPIKILLRVLCIILAAVLVFLLCFHFGEKIRYRSFYKNAEVMFKTPGTGDGFVQQGLCYDDDSDLYIVCGYMGKGASRVYTVDKDGKSRFCELKDSKGADYCGHTGGVARFGDYIYITGDDGLDVFSFADIRDKSEAGLIGSFKTGSDPAYCHREGDLLYVGSFYREGNYETPAHERITTPAGDRNTSVVYIFSLNTEADLGIDGKPVSALSTPGLVQGMCFDAKGRAVLSTSYGLAASHLYVYDLAKADEGTLEVDGKKLGIRYLDSKSLVETVEAPPMSEEIILKDGRIVIMTESASNKYIFGKITSGRRVYGYEMQ